MLKPAGVQRGDDLAESQLTPYTASLPPSTILLGSMDLSLVIIEAAVLELV